MSTRPYPDARGMPESGTCAAPNARAPQAPNIQHLRPRLLTFVILCFACLVTTGGYAILARLRADSIASGVAAEPPTAMESVRLMSRQPHLVFLQTQGDAYRRVGLISLDGPDEPR